ncbi:MAG: hypothetical protein ACXW32_01710 [Limisphaerales bacterium]
MTVLPVVAREMGVMARHKSTYWSRTVTGLLALLVMMWLLLVSRTRVSYADIGGTMFLVLSSLCFAFTVLAGMQATSDSVSEEKREGTLGLLFLTDLKATDVIGGKLAATSLSAVLALMGVIPMLSLALLLGGVTLQQFALVAVVLANTLFLSLSLGVFVSTLSENERKAMMATFVGLLLIVIGPFVAAYLLRAQFGFFEELLAASPLYAFSSLHTRAVGPLAPRYFWPSVLSTHLLAWFFLLYAAWILPRFVNALPSLRFARLRTFAQDFVFGRESERRKHRAELLDRNAFLWLASRERVKPKYAWGVLVFFAALYLWMAWQFPNMMFDFAVAGGIMFLVHLVFKVWAASEVCSRLIQDRRSGALELLLSTPLSVKEIADGQTKALGRLFLKPIALLIGFELLLLMGGLRSTGDIAGNAAKIFLYLAAISTLLLDIWALKWVGLWLSLTGKSIERVLIATILRIMALPWIIFAVFLGILGSALFLQRREPDESEVLGGWWVISMLVSGWFGFSARKKFLDQFRELASKRFDSLPEAEPPVRKPKQKTSANFRQMYRRHPVTATAFTVLAAAFFMGWLRGFYWERQVEAEFAKISADGHPVTLQELARYAPSVPASQNAFLMLQDAGPINLGRQSFPTRKDQTNVTSGELERFRSILTWNTPALEAMWSLPQYTQGSFDLTTLDFWRQRHQQSALACLAEADLLVALHRDGSPDLDRVKKDVIALFQHAQLLREQPAAFAQQCARDSLERLCGVLGFVFDHDALDEGTLLALQKQAEQMAAINIFARTLAIERAQCIDFVENPNTLARFGFVLPRPFTMMESFNEAVGSHDKQLVQALQRYREGILLADKPAAARLAAASVNDLIRGIHLFVNNMSPPVSQMIWTDLSCTAFMNVIRTGLAAELYQRKHGVPPRTLDALVPEFLSAVPEDPFSTEPLRSIYTDRLIIYSVGVDRADNTADMSAPKNRTDLRLPVK